MWGNVWQTDCIARLDPASAAVTGWLLLNGLAERTRAAQPGVPMDVLNGIAHDPQTGASPSLPVFPDVRCFVSSCRWSADAPHSEMEPKDWL